MPRPLTIHVVHVPVVRHRWLRHIIRSFESDPAVQYRIHMTFTYFWLVNMALALAVFLFAQGIWQRASVLYLVLVSLYANFATDYGAVSAAEAAAAGQAVVVKDVLPDEQSEGG